jgi:hypothetical protein
MLDARTEPRALRPEHQHAPPYPETTVSLLARPL